MPGRRRTRSRTMVNSWMTRAEPKRRRAGLLHVVDPFGKHFQKTELQ